MGKRAGCGVTVRFAFPPQSADRLKSDISWERQQGFPVEWLEAGELRERCPGISPAALGAALFPEDGALEPPVLLEALTRSAAAHGAAFRRGERVESLVISGNRVTAARTPTETIPAGAVLLAAGCSESTGNDPSVASRKPTKSQGATEAPSPGTSIDAGQDEGSDTDAETGPPRFEGGVFRIGRIGGP